MSPHFSLSADAVARISADGKAAILDAVARRAAAVYRLDADAVRDALTERERLGSTGFGRAVALPHARLEGLDRPVVVALQLEDPVEFDAADGVPVDLVFGLLSPATAGATHLRALAALSRMVRNDKTQRALADAPDAEALYAIIANEADRDAA